MLLIGSANAGVGMDAGWDVLARGASALDAVEATIRVVESNAADHSVGLGGYPNILGTVELDASIMDGVTRRAGAVGALQGYRHAITAARAVMDQLPHVLVTGDGARRIAALAGLVEEEMLTAGAAKVWRDGVDGRLPDEFRHEATVVSGLLAAATELASDPDTVPGTVDVVAIDGDARIASGVSTSGWAWKFPGRLGDSPLIGAGNYADGRYGAAACAGWGELAIRCATARMVVDGIAHGLSTREASHRAIRDIADLPDLPPGSVMHIVAVAADGSYTASSSAEGVEYVVRDETMAAYVTRPRTVLPLR